MWAILIIAAILVALAMCAGDNRRITDDSSVGTHAIYGTHRVVYPEIDPRTGKNFVSQKFTRKVAHDYAKMFNGRVVKAWPRGKGMKKISPEQFVAQKEFASRLALMQVEAGKLGLFATMHKLHEAIKQVGYEIAGTPELYDKMEKSRAKRLAKI